MRVWSTTSGRTRFAAAFAACCALPLWAAAQDAGTREAVSFERSRVLSSYSRVMPERIPLDIGGGVGKVGEVIVPGRGATSLRLHFVVHAAPPRPTWALVVLDGRDRVAWSHSSAGDASADFWSAEVEMEGGFAKVEVYSTEAGSALRLSIDKIAVAGPVTRPEATTPPDSRAPIGTQSPRIKDLGRAVARLRFVGDDDTGYYCTAVLVAPDLLMTNYHCPQSDGEQRSTFVDFDFDSEGAIPKTLRLKGMVIGDRRLDFAIHRLSAALADRTPLKLDEGNVADGQPLVVIQHPAGQPKQVSLIDCRVSDLGPDAAATDFGHLCDTLGGSSGSAVLDAATGRMLGLHHVGFNEESRRAVNSAVLLKHVADYVRRRKRVGVAAALGLLAQRRRAAPRRPPAN